ncbi:MAG: nucleotidyltransferase [Deltaproteobacteria bacterium]|nr:nucleotidyltransferase [Deltaproteobacteria bacterium]
MDLTDPTGAALLCAEALDAAGLRYAFYGGLVLSAFGEPRETKDVDIAVVDLAAETACRALEESGISCLAAFDGATYGGLSLGRVTLLGGEGHLGLNVLDLVRPRSARYASAALDRAVDSDFRGRVVRLVTPEDYVLFKALATRDRDRDDAASVLRRTGDVLDFALLDREVDALALEIPDWDVRGSWSVIRARGGY